MTESKRGYSIWDIIVKVVLIAVIIILLLHNCSIVKKLNDEKNSPKPTGNVDIFEIKCEKETCKDVLGEQKENPKPAPTPVVNPGGNGNNNQQPTTKPDTKPTTDDNKNNNNNNNDNNNNNNGGQTDPGTVTPDPGNDPGNDSGNDPTTNSDLTVKDTIEWKSQNELRIFSNPAYQMQPKIAPESSNTYQFIVRNNTNSDVKYKIEFNETNANHINMKYRLKRGDSYVISSWVSYDELNLSDILLSSGADHTYYLEWKWFSSDNDTAVGANANSKYSLNIIISAESQGA